MTANGNQAAYGSNRIESNQHALRVISNKKSPTKDIHILHNISPTADTHTFVVKMARKWESKQTQQKTWIFA